MAGEEKLKRYKLAMLIYDNDAPELSIEDLAKIKELVGKAYVPLIVGQVWSMLEKEDMKVM